MKAVLAAAVAVCLLAGCTDQGEPPPHSATSVEPEQPVPPTDPATLIQTGPVFGIHPMETTAGTVDQVTSATGCRPQWTELFVNVAGGTSPERLRTVPGVIVLSLEPWVSKAVDPDWTLQATLDGRYDTQYRRVADAVRAYRQPLFIRFAHEMNGVWYPWGPQAGNTPAQYIQVWKHVRRIFTEAGAVNAVWIWSPNILRGAVKVPLSAFYPGDDAVDFVGLTGYGDSDTNPAGTYGATMQQINKLTKKPMILTETGARPHARKTGWIAAFGSWLKANPRIVGFVWSLRVPGQGARYDWRFDDSPQNLAAFKTSLKTAGVPC